MPIPRVMFVNHASELAGAELVLLDVVRAWRGASVFLFEDGPLNEALEKLGLRVIISRWACGFRKVRRDGSLWKAAPLLARLGAIAWEIAVAARHHDVMYANSQKAFTLAAVASILARRPLIWHLHDIIDSTHFGTSQRRLQIVLANWFAAQVVVPSQAAAAAFVAGGGRRDLIRVVPNGVDVLPDHRPRSELRIELGLPDMPLVGVFSRLAPWKGQHILLEALATIPNVRCVIAGDALFGEQAYATHLKQLVSEFGLDDRAYFLGHRNDVPRLMQAVDIMIHPSVAPEPFGRTLVEAMVAGVPIIATDTGATADVLAGGAAGTLVPANDPAALAAAITRILARPEYLTGQLACAAKRAREQYGIGRMLESVSSLIDHVARGA